MSKTGKDILSEYFSDKIGIRIFPECLELLPKLIN